MGTVQQFPVQGNPTTAPAATLAGVLREVVDAKVGPEEPGGRPECPPTARQVRRGPWRRGSAGAWAGSGTWCCGCCDVGAGRQSHGHGGQAGGAPANVVCGRRSGCRRAPSPSCWGSTARPCPWKKIWRTARHPSGAAGGAVQRGRSWREAPTDRLVRPMLADLGVQQMPTLAVGVVQDGAPELWNLLAAGLADRS